MRSKEEVSTHLTRSRAREQAARKEDERLSGRSSGQRRFSYGYERTGNRVWKRWRVYAR